MFFIFYLKCNFITFSHFPKTTIHPEGIKGAEAVSSAIFLAKCGKSEEEIRQYISQRYYNPDFTLTSIRDRYHFEDAIRNAISIGGGSDTIAAN